MRIVCSLGLFILGAVLTGCGSDSVSIGTAPTPQNSGADKNPLPKGNAGNGGRMPAPPK
jgi:hypothetical protein